VGPRRFASDGVACYRSCPTEDESHLCRGKDWEVRGSRLELPDVESFEAIAVSGGELYAIDDANVRVLDLASGRETRRFTLPRLWTTGVASGSATS
jgi:hypothetical protein